MVVEKWTENVPHRGGFCGKHSRQEGSDCYLTGSIPYPGAGNFNPSGCKPDLAHLKPYLVEKKSLSYRGQNPFIFKISVYRNSQTDELRLKNHFIQQNRG